MARILLVDDDIAEISAVKRVLTRVGHVPALATNASDALASIEAARPELVVLSTTCDGGGALELARQLDEEYAGLPMVLLGEAPRAPARARRVPRPVDPAQLQDEVAALLSTAATAPAPATVPAPARAAAPARTATAVPAARTAPPPATSPSASSVAAGARAPARTANGAPSPSRTANGAPPPASAAEPPAAAARRAAAEALRARAEELRRRPATAADGAAGAERVTVATPPPSRAPAQDAPAPQPPPAAVPASALELEDDGLEAVLRRAEEAERAKLAEDERARAEARRREEDARRVAEAEAARELEEMAAREAEAESAREREAQAAQEAAARVADAEARARREADAQAARARRDAEERAQAEAAARADAAERQRLADEARRARDAEEKAAAEAEARRRAEEELARVREQLDAERRSAEERIASLKERAAADEEAADELRRFEEEEARRKAALEARAHEEEEEKLRQAIESARAEMEALRRRSEEEARRRAEAEAELRRVEDEARRRAEADAELRRVGEEARRRAELAALRTPPHAASPLATFADPPFAPFEYAAPEPPSAAALPLDPAEEVARRRVAALRGATLPPAAQAPAPWTEPVLEPAPAPEPAPAAAPLPAPPPELRGGTLADLPAPRVLALAARARLQGRLDFQGEWARSLWFEDGRVVGASSADPAERVEEVALRLGLVTRDQHRQIARAAASLATRRAAVLLLERGFLKPTELSGLVRRRTEEVVFGVFADAGARFAWAAHEVPADERTALERGALALAVEGVRRRWLAARVDALLGGPGTLLAPVSGGPAAAELGLSPEERRAVALADGLRTADEIVLASPLDALTTRQLLAALVLVGALGVRVLQAGRPQAERAQAIDLARVREKLDQARRADYFTVLGVGRLCTPHEVREASDRLLAELDPRRYDGARDDTLPATLAEIHAVVKDARDVLADDRLREEYLRGLGD
ncbi:response regulator [Anaeromyxobacter oryzae]|uniref:Uncharacterized protein n=1 Tax=Anaeromyxobacter oryzae TaxID=2918170 RepID=A0ABM7WY46_9BACT|nr:response regulator [Anaeromyxobacter oryzae]BDG04387.1 hypothetical protein AMOR_33830 [Anaeromyxobacter oryzae]